MNEHQCNDPVMKGFAAAGEGCALIILACLIGIAVAEYFPQVLAVIEKFAK